MENREDILDALTAFGKNPNQQEIPLILERYLNRVAKNGETFFPWTQLKPLIVGKMEKVIQELKQGLDAENIPSRPNVENVRFDVMHARIVDALHRFNGAPFTIQRLCELLTDPKRHYKRSDKFMRGLEKNVLVVSTVDPFGRKVVCESSSKHMVNGMDVNGTFPPRDTALTVPLPPVPGWVTTSSAATSSQTPTSASESVADQRLSSQPTTQTPGVVSNGIVSSGLASSVYTDQGEQLAVQTEEVIEETVVTMETNEVSSVTTDAGEALAEGEEYEDMADDRTSSSSSSSSSSEELSTSSDSIDSNIQGTTSAAASSSSLDPGASDNRPWAAIAEDEEAKRQVSGSQSPLSSNSENQEQSENTTKDNPCSPPTSTTEVASSSCSPDDTGPASFTPESTCSSDDTQPAVADTVHPSPESSLQDSPQSTQTTRFDAASPSSEDTPSPNDSISTSVPDSLQSSDKPSADVSPPASPSGQHPNPASSLDPDSQTLSSSSDSNTDDGTAIDSTCDRLTASEPSAGSMADPAVSSSSSIYTSSSTVPTSDCDVRVAKPMEGLPDSVQSTASAENDMDSEPLRKRLKLSNDEGVGETVSSCVKTDLEEASAPAQEEETMECVHSSADDLAPAPAENSTTNRPESEEAEGSVRCEPESDNSPESQGFETPVSCAGDPSKGSPPPCPDKSKESDVTEKVPDSAASDESSESQMSVG